MWAKTFSTASGQKLARCYYERTACGRKRRGKKRKKKGGKGRGKTKIAKRFIYWVKNLSCEEKTTKMLQTIKTRISGSLVVVASAQPVVPTWFNVAWGLRTLTFAFYARSEQCKLMVLCLGFITRRTPPDVASRALGKAIVVFIFFSVWLTLDNDSYSSTEVVVLTNL